MLNEFCIDWNGDFRYTNRIQFRNTHLCHVTIMHMSVTTATQMQLQNESSHCLFVVFEPILNGINRVFKVKQGSVYVSYVMDYR